MSEKSSETERKLPPVGDVCWLEIPATDMARCQTFYKTVFGWEFATMPNMPAGSENCYTLFSKPGTKLGGGVYLVKEGELLQPHVDADGKGQGTSRLTMRVEDIDVALKSVEAAGGKIVHGKREIGGDHGFSGMFRDTEGNINGVWSPASA